MEAFASSLAVGDDMGISGVKDTIVWRFSSSSSSSSSSRGTRGEEGERMFFG